MIELTAAAVRQMREETGLGMMECKKILTRQIMQEKLNLARETKDFDILVEVVEYLLSPN